MIKTNIDKLVQNKLQDLNYDFKPEYWDKMENKLNASALSSSTNTATTILGSKIFLISISSILLIAGGIGAYYALNNENNVCNDINNTNEIIVSEGQSDYNINTENTMVISKPANSSKAVKKTTSDIIDIEESNIKSTKSYAVVSVEESEPFIESNKDMINEVINENKNNCDPYVEKDINEIDVVLLKDSNLKEVEEDDGIYVVSKLNLKDKAEAKDKKEKVNNSKEQEQENIDDSEVKDVKPMRKPSGRVFRKKGGLLKRFGL